MKKKKTIVLNPFLKITAIYLRHFMCLKFSTNGICVALDNGS